MKKPKLFIASSVESLDIADAININLDHFSEITLWKNAFELSGNTIDSLISIAEKVDFATFILAPDDVTNIRESEHLVPRDNVIFELGLFIGTIGKKRCFIVKPRDIDIHLPTDLLGITTTDFENNRSDDDLNSALNYPCSLMKNSIQKLGLLSKYREVDTRELSVIQHSGLKAVWVYAPNPLEAISTGSYIKLRNQVYQNIMAGVKYVYFVESEQGITRIKDLVQRMHDEADEKLRNQDKLVSNIKIVELTPLHFLTHFTVHHQYSGEIEVYQSVVRSDRNDKLEKLDSVRSEQVRMLISEQISKIAGTYEDGIEVLRNEEVS